MYKLARFACSLLLACMMVPSQAHEGHDHGPPLAMSVAFDQHGQLWRVVARDGLVWLERAQGLGDDTRPSFGQPVQVSREVQKIGTEGDARPKLAVGPQGQLYVTWTQALPTPYTGYVWFASSSDGGASFSAPVLVHHDRAEITHAFDSIAVAPNGRLYLSWVDKRDLVAAQAAGKPYPGAALYYTWSDDGGASFQPERKLADHSCECCRIALATKADGKAVALWRHVFDGGIRDHAMAELDGAAPVTVHRASFGGWKLGACPHQGPALAQGGDWGWHMAWFDGGAKPGLYYARMDGAAWVTSPAKRFGDLKQQASRPALASHGEQVWLVWKELTADSSLVKLALSADGGRSWQDSQQVASTAGASDHPQLVQWQGHTYLSWNTAQGWQWQRLPAP